MAPPPLRPIVVQRRKKAAEEGHHGGAWKIAYADFVTAMMAFFLLMWLINVTSPDQKNGIAEYFNPVRVSQSRSGADGLLAGAALGPPGAMQVPAPASAVTAKLQSGGAAAKAVPDPEPDRQRREREARRFADVAQELRQALAADAALRELSQNLLVDQTPEGLRIQLVDRAERPMFELGSAEPLPHTRDLLALVGRVVDRLPNRISIRGHTDARPYAGTGYGNWDLSAARALASRQALALAGIEDARIEGVVGRADRDPLVPTDPLDPRNRRISIILLNEAAPAALGDGRAGPGPAG